MNFEVGDVYVLSRYFGVSEIAHEHVGRVCVVYDLLTYGDTVVVKFADGVELVVRDDELTKPWYGGSVES